MSVKLLTEHLLEFLSLKGGCTGSCESILVKMPHCWKSHVTAQILVVMHMVTRVFFLPLLSCHTRHLESSPRLRMSLNVNTSIWSFSNGFLLVSDFFKCSVPESPLPPNIITNILASVPAPLTLEVFTLIL